MNIKNSKQETKSRTSFIIMLVGVFVLIIGLIFFLIKILAKPGIPDGNFLVSVGTWELETNANCTEETNCENGSGVIWNFTEIGKGTLTTNDHINDYNFIWAIEGDKLKIETSWLYDLNDEFIYKLDQNNKILILNPGEEEIKFVPAITESAE